MATRGWDVRLWAVPTMKLFVALCSIACAAVPGIGAPDDGAILAAMKLSERPTYSWTTSVEDDAGAYLLEGKTTAAGFSWVRMPPPPALARRLGREADLDLEVFFHGANSLVLSAGGGWRTLAEIPRERARWEEPVVWNPRSRSGSPAPTDPLGIPAVMLQGPSEEERRPYSNRQLALSLPHEELAIIASSAAELRVDGPAISGVLTNLGAQLLLIRDGQEHLTPLAAAGVFKLQVTDGMVTRYWLRLEGLLLVNEKKVLVHQSSHTAIRNVGTTVVEVPEEARRKLAP